MADENVIPDKPLLEGPVWFDPEVLKETGQVFVNYKILPYPGGWMQQPRWWTMAMQNVYLPGINRAKYDALPQESKNTYHSRPKKVIIPPGGEW